MQQSSMGNTFSSTELLPLSTMENDHEREKLEHNDKNVKQKKPPAIVPFKWKTSRGIFAIYEIYWVHQQ